MRRTNLNDGEFRRYIGETAACLLPPISAEFSAKLGSDFGARSNKAVLVKTRLQAIGTEVRSSWKVQPTKILLGTFCRIKRGTSDSHANASWR
jgi:hypothetical protein